MEWPDEAGKPKYSKVPTTILYSRDLKPIYWGWEAYRYKDNEGAIFLSKFKLNLREAYNEENPLPRDLKPERVIADYIRLVVDYALVLHFFPLWH